MNLKFKINKRGAIALTSTIILSVVIAVISLSIVFLNLSSRMTVFNLLESESVFVKTDGCTEEALIQLSRDSTYTGDTYTVDGLSCTASVSGAGDNRSVTISGSEGEFTHDFSIDVQINPSFAIIDWGE